MGEGKVLRVGTLTPIASLDPQRAHDFTGHLVLSQVFESLYARVEQRIEPRLALGMPQRQAGNTAVNVELRPDARFSDGTALTAKHVADALAPMLAPYGVEIQPAGARVALRAGVWNHRPEELLAGIGMRVARPGTPFAIGTGPFRIAHAARDLLRLVRNEHAARQPSIEAVEVQCFAPGADGRPGELLAALEGGRVDFTLALARDDVAELKSARKLFQAGMSTAFLAINTEQRHLSDPQVRRGLALAIDRYRLTELCFTNPAAFVARGLLPPALGRGNDGLRHDPAAAAALLADAGLPTLRMLRVWGPRPYLARPDAVAAAITAQLRDLDVHVETIVSSDSEDYGARIAAADYDLVLGGWIADTTDPVDYLQSTIGSAGILEAGHNPGTACNYARWRDDAVDALLVAARTTGGQRAIDDALARVASEVPCIPLMYGARVIVHGWHVKGYDPEASLMPDFAALTLES
jgi:ABC-type transport system substrate-binding protein